MVTGPEVNAIRARLSARADQAVAA
jgi:hypothetical protein